MPKELIAVQLPQVAYQKLKRAADLTYRSVDEMLLNTINAALVAPSDLPPDLANELAALHFFSDEALWAAAQPTLSPAAQYRLQQLNHHAGEQPLTEAESKEQKTLLESYHHSVLRRAQALAILTQRGHTIPRTSPNQGLFDDEIPHP
ncbi:MAG TPA: hypothetical protein G4N96_02800 [Chloroflexi bacterium]|nr:MAG: hypothetical protein B6243_05250 [Anaerolineaceae bacterium 4572_5.2]HEY84032.1 hypothetical protein [Chloroflexota bacterium]